MKIRLLQPISFILVLAFGLMITFTGCESEPEQMDLPPAGSFVMDLSQFPTNNSNTKSIEAAIGNWLYSYTSVVAWNVVIAVNMAIPVAAYAEAFDHVPVYLGDNSWDWSYSVPVGDFTYEATLIGTRIDKETFSMEMTLSQVGGFQDFEWFKGVIRYDHSEADWTISQSPLQPKEYLNIHYQKDLDNEISNIRYTVTDPENEWYNAFIEFGLDPSQELNAHYTIHNSIKTTYIEWNTVTNAGHVMDEVYFMDGDWHCWDTQLQDVECTVE